MLAFYRIPDVNKAEVEERIAKLAKRATKLGLAVPTFTWDLADRTPITKVVSDEGIGPAHTVVIGYTQWYTLTLEAEDLVVGNYALVAVVTGTPEGNIISAVPGQSCPVSFRDGDATRCDHCKVSRRRTETFVVRDAADTYLQVGRQCIADFLGGNDPHKVAEMAEMLGAFDGFMAGMGDEDRCGGVRRDRTNDLKGVLTLAAYAVNTLGWVSRKFAMEYEKRSTSSVVLTLLDGSTKEQKALREEMGRALNDADRQLAADALAWATAQFAGDDVDPNTLSDYGYNLRLVVRLGYTEPRTFGLAVSIVGSYVRTLQERAEKAARPVSQHVGTVDKRQEFGPCEVVFTKVMEGYYGVSTLVLVVTAEGNLLKWKASGEVNLQKGDKLSQLKATVKEHSAYDGTLQTVIQRAAYTVIEEPAPEPAPEAAPSTTREAALVGADDTDLPF